jgi:hypothetical protein
MLLVAGIPNATAGRRGLPDGYAIDGGLAASYASPNHSRALPQTGCAETDRVFIPCNLAARKKTFD